MFPARLHNADVRVAEVRDGFEQKIGIRHKVGVKDGDKLTAGLLQPIGQGTGFEAFPLRPPHVRNRYALLPVIGYLTGNDVNGIVGRIVEDLNLQLFGRIAEFDDRINQPLSHVQFVIYWQLYRNGWQLLPRNGIGSTDIGPALLLRPQVNRNQTQLPEVVNKEQQ